MSYPKLRWPSPNCDDFLYVITTTFRESLFGLKVTLQILGGQLLTTFPDAFVDVTDNFGSSPALEIVFPKVQLREIEAELKRLELRHGAARLIDSLYRIERCLNYSIVWRLSPHWNQVGRMLVMGDKYLDNHDYHWFVEAYLKISSEIVLEISNLAMVQLKPVTLEGLFYEILGNESEQEKLRKRLADGERVVCRSISCFVLPMLNEAEVIAISQTPSGTIDTPEKMSSYWAARYGYRIDSKLSAKETFYCEVAFLDGSRFVYPHFCVKLDRGSVSYRPTDPSAMNDLQKNLNELLSHITRTSDVVSTSR